MDAVTVHRNSRSVRSLPFLGIAASLAASMALACSRDATGPVTSVGQDYWALQLNAHAVNMALPAPYNTFQLRATPLNVTGDSLTGLGPVRYTAGDSSVAVSSTGMVTALYSTAQTYVVARLQDTVRKVTNVDTVYIQVTDTAPQAKLKTFSIHPFAGDSATRAISSIDFGTVLQREYPWPVFATDAAGDTVCTAAVDASGAAIVYSPTCALLVSFTSSDPTIAEVNVDGVTKQRNTWHVTGKRPGHVTIYATTVAYGTVWRDSLPFDIGWPVLEEIGNVWTTPPGRTSPVLSFSPTQVTVGPGATITWSAGGILGGIGAYLQLFSGLPLTPFGDSVDVVFDDPDAVKSGCALGWYIVSAFCALYPHADSGNIRAFYPDTAALTRQDIAAWFPSVVQSRTFPKPGTYTYHSSKYPSARGTVIVLATP